MLVQTFCVKNSTEDRSLCFACKKYIELENFLFHCVFAKRELLMSELRSSEEKANTLTTVPRPYICCDPKWILFSKQMGTTQPLFLNFRLFNLLNFPMKFPKVATDVFTLYLMILIMTQKIIKYMGYLSKKICWEELVTLATTNWPIIFNFQPKWND